MNPRRVPKESQTSLSQESKLEHIFKGQDLESIITSIKSQPVLAQQVYIHRSSKDKLIPNKTKKLLAFIIHKYIGNNEVT